VEEVAALVEEEQEEVGKMTDKLITILGPTASGKTAFATHLAKMTGSEIISADSRQIYRNMDIGTGKDISEYTVEGTSIPYHLIDIRNPGDKYTLFEYQQDFQKAYDDIIDRGKCAILCGGTGLYIETVLKGYSLPKAPANHKLRAELEAKSIKELADILEEYRPLHNTTDTKNKRRVIRAIEIEEQRRKLGDQETPFSPINSVILGIYIERDLRREKITKRLKSRLEEGMVEEVKGILDTGVSAEDLIYYGLEYKYVTLYAIGEISFDEMFSKLEIAIHQFAKRQMTWFRGMERRGFTIHWIDASLPMEEKMELAYTFLKAF